MRFMVTQYISLMSFNIHLASTKSKPSYNASWKVFCVILELIRAFKTA